MHISLMKQSFICSDLVGNDALNFILNIINSPCLILNSFALREVNIPQRKKRSLGMLCKRYKEECDRKIEENSKKLNYSNKNEETHKKARREVHIAQAV